MSKTTIRPMEPEDWEQVSRIYLEGIATEYATFQGVRYCPILRGMLLTQKNAALFWSWTA